MRTFQLIFLMVFLILYLLISFGAFKSFIKLFSEKNRKRIFWIFVIWTLSIILSFIILYIWPYNTRELRDYTAHLIFNAIFSIEFVFKIPLAFSFLIGLFFSVIRKPVIYFMGLILSASMSLSLIYGVIFGTRELVVNKVELSFTDLPGEFNNYKLLQISDIHLGNFLKSQKLLQKVQEQVVLINPDIILFTGDLVDNFSDELNGWENIFKSITKDRICYSILGNHDYGNYSDWKDEESKVKNFKEIVTGQKTFGFDLLDNSNVKIKSANDSIFIIGVENWGHPPFPQYADLGKAMNNIPEETFKILLSHDPAHWNEKVKYRNDIDLTLSGHSHGMQWGIMKAGITFSLSYLTRENWGGLYKYNNSQLYVSTGLGTVGIPWRINMPPEMTVLTLKRIKINRE